MVPFPWQLQELPWCIEAGVSAFDLTGEVHSAYKDLAHAFPEDSFDQMVERLAPVMDPWEDRIFYRTISPRHFEAAAFGICQILFEGAYSEILQPWRHYLPLKKDFSNFEEIVAHVLSPSARQTITQKATRDLIASEAYSYRGFIGTFDRLLEVHGVTQEQLHRGSERLPRYHAMRMRSLPLFLRHVLFAVIRRLYRWTQSSPFAKRFVVPIIQPVMVSIVRRYKRRREKRMG